MCYKLCTELIRLICTYDTFEIILKFYEEENINLKSLYLNENFLKV